MIDRDAPTTIEEFLNGRKHNPKLTLKLMKDVARRIKKLEKKMEVVK